MIDTDTRQLKRKTWNGSDYFKSGAGKIVCDHCGINTTCTRAMLEGSLCAEFLPAIPFQDETGLDRPSNTVRVGVAWTQRLRIGDRIALYHAKAKRIFGHAIVTDLVAGPIADVLRDHAHNNHLMLDHDPATAAGELRDWQLRNYGPRIINEKTRLTAIYLQREPAEDAAADHHRPEEDRAA